MGKQRAEPRVPFQNRELYLPQRGLGKQLRILFCDREKSANAFETWLFVWSGTRPLTRYSDTHQNHR